MTEFLGDQLRRVRIDHVGDLVHRALLHQQPDDVDSALRHAVGEFLDIDGFRDHHLANELFLRLVRRMSLEPLGAAAERRDRALAHIVRIEGCNQRQAAALLLRRGLRGRLRCGGGTYSAAGATTDLARTFVLVGDIGGNTWRSRDRHRGAACGGGSRGCRGGLGFGLAETLLGFEFGLALGFLVLTMTFLFGLAAGLGGLALGLFDAFLAVAPLGFFFRQPPLFDVADFGVSQRTGARRAFVFGQGAQHHA